MLIQIETTPNPNSLKFIPGKNVSNSGQIEITQKDETNNDLVKNLLSINGVIQQPTADYTIESDSTIVFSTAPESSDVIFGSFIGEVAASFDIADNTVDEFTANGSTTTFTLSKTVSSNNDILVTLDGVTQYPNTQSAYAINTRRYR